MAGNKTLLPEVTDADIAWVASVMDLRDVDAARQAFLRTPTTIDVSACPGSGKTTLIVAKLAILARKWPHTTSGICVLSHTNAAREEIQRRLSGTVVGQQLLGYPHFIDTIHSFVNRFLALPWLRSKGYSSLIVDDNVTTTYRRGVLTTKELKGIEAYLSRKHTSFENIRLIDRHMNFGVDGKAFPAGSHTETYQNAKKAIDASAEAGYFCYDEMFIWAKALITDNPSLPRWLESRFPLVIIDEMQDTTKLQAGILESIFSHSGSSVALQRIGDPNQTIFNSGGPVDLAPRTFSEACSHLTISRSFRFGPKIASLASPFAVAPVGPAGLEGAGPRKVVGASRQSSNAIFVFPDNEPEGVLDAYGKYVLSNFDDTALENTTVAAVGARHEEAREVVAGHPHFPKTVPHYWSSYTPEIRGYEQHPRTLVQYIRVAKTLVMKTGDLSPGLEKLASGLARLSRCYGEVKGPDKRAHTHRGLMEALEDSQDAKAAYQRVSWLLLVDPIALTAELWNVLKTDLVFVAKALNTNVREKSKRADDFLCWGTEGMLSQPTDQARDLPPNVYLVEDSFGRSVEVSVGTVHSVKGQTHLSTLLLSTYWHDHLAGKILPWLLGEKANLSGAGKRDRTRLLQTYVAMTRPSHLVCLAIPRSALGNTTVCSSHIATLRQRGWSVRPTGAMELP